MFPISAFAQCVDNEDCVSLGYNKTSCKTPGLKCPFGEYYYCPKDCEDGYEWKDGACQPEEPEAAIFGQCNGYTKNCKIADIIYSDGTCSSDVISEKKPIGIVIYISKDNCGWIMPASPITPAIPWSTQKVATSIGATTNHETAIKDFDACTNTQKITQQGNENTYPAAWAAINYAPSAIPETKGKWCLPAPGMLDSLYNNLNTINNTISKLEGKQLANNNEHIWSSSEFDYIFAWTFCTNCGLTGAGTGGVGTQYKYYNNHVRPVIEF